LENVRIIFLREIEVNIDMNARDDHKSICLNSDIDEVMMSMVDQRGLFGVYKISFKYGTDLNSVSNTKRSSLKEIPID
jgi:hypothetical protein